MVGEVSAAQIEMSHFPQQFKNNASKKTELRQDILAGKTELRLLVNAKAGNFKRPDNDLQIPRRLMAGRRGILEKYTRQN